MRSDRAFPSLSRHGREVLISRLLAVVAAACLLTAATALLLGQAAAHPRHWAVALVCTPLGLRIVAHAPRNAVGWLILVMGVSSAVTLGTHAAGGLFVAAWLSTWSWWPSCALLPVVALVFPSGGLRSRRWWPVLIVAGLGLVLPVVGIGWGAWSSPATFWDDAVSGTAPGGLPTAITAIGILCLFAALVGALCSLVVRWLRADRGERRVLVWSVVCSALLIPTLFLDMAGPGTFWGAWVVVAAAFPVATVVAILWYGLYDIDLLVHRSVLFGSLTTALAVAYTVTVVAFTSPPTPGHVAGTVVVVLLLAPLHRRLRAHLDRWLFGDRADPYRALARLGEQLANPLQPDEVFRTVARSVAGALKLPYVAVRVDSTLTTSGVSRQWPQLTFPLRYDGDDMGALIVEARAPEEGFGRCEQRLLVDLARHAALAARSARLAARLRRIGEEHVEDLAYITGEVHDNVASGVAAVRLQVDALHRSVPRSDHRLGEKLGQIVDDLTGILLDIRDVVRRVRPAGLHAGLVETVRRRAASFAAKGLAVTITPVGLFDRLSASLEVEAYRIVSAALANVAEHANASACEIRFVKDTERLAIHVTDDGEGIPPDAVPGFGLDSMRRRCEHRGGSFEIERLHRGTHVVAVLPLREPVLNKDPDGRTSSAGA